MTAGGLAVAVIILVMWGLWGFFAKLAAASLGWKLAWITQGVANLAFFLTALLVLRPQFAGASGKGMLFAALAGIMGPLASILFYVALTRARTAAVIVPLTALYPLVTVVLLFLFLHERVTVTQAVGIAFAVLAVVLLAL